jgi:cell division protein FtsB
MTQKKLKKIIKWITVAVTAFVVLSVGIITYQCIKIGVLNSRSKKLDQISANLTAQEQSVDSQLEKNGTAAYQEQLAREKYGLVKDGETIYITQN